MKTSIVILTHNQLAHTVQCLDSIARHTSKDMYELIVVDNASSDGTRAWLEAHRRAYDLRLILNDDNVGFPEGCNQGMHIATGAYFLLLNNDTIVTPNWLPQLLTCMQSDERIGAVGPVTNTAAYFTAIPVRYDSLEGMERFAGQYNRSNPAFWDERVKLVGFCMLLRREAVEKVGWLDVRFSPGNYEDDDYCYRLREAGYRLVQCRDTFIHHAGSASFHQDVSAYTELNEVNRRKFLDKWGFDSWNYSKIRFDLLRWIDSPREAPIRVLEIGCACGATLLEIKNRYKQAELHGIELNPHAAKIASLTADVYCADAELIALPYDEASFDYIIFSDVLEHLRDPWTLMRGASLLLKPGGAVLASLLNIAHYSVVRKLLNGSFTYTESGLLERTQMRFFTLQDICNLFGQAGLAEMRYEPNEFLQSQEDARFVEGLSLLSDNPAESAKQLVAHQYVLRAAAADRNRVEERAPSRQLSFALRRVEWRMDAENHADQIVRWLSEGAVTARELRLAIERDIVRKEETAAALGEAAVRAGLAESAEAWRASLRPGGDTA